MDAVNTRSINRRRFLLAASGALAAPALSAKTRDLYKAIMYETIGLKGSVLEKFQAVKAAGFEGIEPMSHMSQNEVLDAFAATGLKPASCCCSTHWKKPLSDPDPAVRQAGLDGLIQALRDAKAYGASSVLLVPAVVNKTVAYDVAYKRSQEQIRKAIPVARELGVKIAIENVWNQFLLSPLEAARYVDEFESPAMAWHFDVGNVINTGWPEQWIHIVGTRIHKLHIKEYSRKKRDQEGLWKGFEVEYLEGDNNWPAVMKALDQIGYKGWGTAEPAYSPKGVDTATRLKQVSAKLDQIFAL